MVHNRQHEWDFMGNGTDGLGDWCYCGLCKMWSRTGGKPFKMNRNKYQQLVRDGIIADVAGIDVEKILEHSEEQEDEETEKVCEFCSGTGEVTEDVWDEDSHTYQPTGTAKCICVIRRENDYRSD